MALARQALYALVGAGDLTLEKVRNAHRVVDRSMTQKLYADCVNRGRTLSSRISASAPTKRAMAQTRTARAQVKAAATSVSKAVRLDARAARSAAEKVAKAS